MKTEEKVCKETMQGMADPTHLHTCSGKHDNGDHFCPTCKRWWYKKPTSQKETK